MATQDDDTAAELLRSMLDADADLSGQSLGPYHLEEKLGTGGRGNVYRAWADDGRIVTVEVLQPGAFSDPARRGRFLREARATVAASKELLDHVAEVIEVGESGGVPFLVAAYVEGPTLRERLDEDGPLPIDEVRTIARDLAAALAATHAAGLVHRDLKPANLVRAEGGGLRLLDFGLARPPEEGDKKAPAGSAGQPVGTPAYMAPEQAKGLPTDARADVFAAGVVLYELLTGRAPFGGMTVVETFIAIARDTPKPVRERREDAPDDLVQLIERCLEKDPAARFADGAALEAAVATASGDGDAPADSPAPAPSASALSTSATSAGLVNEEPAEDMRPQLAVAVIAVLVAVALGLWAASTAKPRAPRSVALASVPVVSDDDEVQTRFVDVARHYFDDDLAAAQKGARALLASSDAPRLLAFMAVLDKNDTSHTDELLASAETRATGGAKELVALTQRMLHPEGKSAEDLRAGWRGYRDAHPKDYFGLLLLADAMLQADLEGAPERYGELSRLDDSVPHVFRQLAVAYASQGELEGWRETIRRGLARHPDHPGLLGPEGDLLLHEGKPRPARDRFETVLASRPQDLGARAGLLEAARLLGNVRVQREQVDALLSGVVELDAAVRLLERHATWLVSRGRLRDVDRLSEKVLAKAAKKDRAGLLARFFARRGADERYSLDPERHPKVIATLTERGTQPDLHPLERGVLQYNADWLRADRALEKGETDAATALVERLQGAPAALRGDPRVRAVELGWLKSRLGQAVPLAAAPAPLRYVADGEAARRALDKNDPDAAQTALQTAVERAPACANERSLVAQLCRVPVARAHVDLARLVHEDDPARAASLLEGFTRLLPEADADHLLMREADTLLAKLAAMRAASAPTVDGGAP